MTQSQLERFNEIKSWDKLLLTVADVAPVLECNPNDVRGQAHDKPEMLGFPVLIYGTRVKIPRLPFIQFMEQLPCSCQMNKRNEVH